MATSGQTLLTMSARQIIKSAFMLINVVPATQVVPEADELEAINTLNCMLADWSMDGITPWRKPEGSLPLVDGQAQYTLQEPIEIVEMRFRRTDSAIDDITLDEIEHDEYFDLPNKASPGCPTQFYYRRGRVDHTLYIWPVPNGASLGTLEYTFNRGIEYVSVATDELDVPEYWFNAVKYNLAALLADMYGGDTVMVGRVTERAYEMKMKAEMFEREGSVYTFPDERYEG